MDVSDVLDQLKAREPLFHHRDLVHSAETFDAETADDFWEVGASGRVLSREEVRREVLRRLAGQSRDDMVSQGWRTEQHDVRPLGDDTYLLTYVLYGQRRVTRRATIWRLDPTRGWHALYHQGTRCGLGQDPPASGASALRDQWLSDGRDRRRDAGSGSGGSDQVDD